MNIALFLLSYFYETHNIVLTLKPGDLRLWCQKMIF